MERETRWKLHFLIWLVVTGVVVAVLTYYLGFGDLKPWPFKLDGKQWELAEPAWLWILALLPALYLIQAFTLTDFSWPQRALSLLFRSLVIAVLALALTRPRTVSKHRKVTTIFLVDVSDSVSSNQVKEARAYIQKIYDKLRKQGTLAKGESNKSGNAIKIITFAQRPRLVRIPKEAKRIPELKRHGPSQSASTDAQAAMQLAYGLFPSGHVPRLVIFSDGIQTKGDLLAEAYRAKDIGIKVHHVTFTREPRDEVLIRDVTLPKKIDVGRTFELQANVFTNHSGCAKFTLKYGADPNSMIWNEQKSSQVVPLIPGRNNPVVFPAKVDEPGLVAYVVRMTPSNGPCQGEVKDRRTGKTVTKTFPPIRDTVKANNRGVAILTVKDKPKLLLVEGHGTDKTQYFVRAMRQEDIRVEVRSQWGLPSTVFGMNKFDCVILSDVRADYVGLRKMAALDNYVRNHSGCFIMVGGDDSFGSGGYYRSRIERMLPVRMDTDKSQNKPSIALVLIIDRSGSMGGPKIEMAKEAAKASAMLLSSSDLIGVIAHDSLAVPVIPLTRAANRLRIQGAISQLTAGGGTDILPALQMGYEWLRSAQARLKHIIVLSDGVSANRERIMALSEEIGSSKITVSTVGLGTGADAGMLKQMARNGGGRAYFTADPSNVPKIFTRETTLASKSGIVDALIKAQRVKMAAFLRGVNIESSPFLRGYNPTKAKHRADVFLKAGPFNDPLLARWRWGLGKTAAFTSDIKSRWARDWIGRWLHGFKQLWTQFLRDTMRTRNYDQYRMFTKVESGRVHVTIDAVDKHDTFQNHLVSGLKVYDWWNPNRVRRLKLKQTAAGRYEAKFTMHRYGAYVLQATHQKQYRTKPRKKGGKWGSYKQTIAESFGSVTLTYPKEYLHLQPSRRECRRDPSYCPGLITLRRTSEITDGKPLASADTSLSALFHVDKKNWKEHYEDMWHWLVYLMMGLLLLDILLRRVRIFGFKPLRAS